MAEERSALIAINVEAREPLAEMRKAVRWLSKDFKIEAASPVYRLNWELKELGGSAGQRNFERLIVVLRVLTRLDFKEVATGLRETEKKFNANHLGPAQGATKVFFLAYEDVACMVPQLTLPHPELHSKPYFAVPAAEVWGSYRHPVLQQELQSLTRPFIGEKWGEFYAQSKALLDF